MTTIKTGTVKFFNESKGFGFIKLDDEDTDIFVHKTETREYLNEDDKVQFEVQHGEKGAYASNVELIES